MGFVPRGLSLSLSSVGAPDTRLAPRMPHAAGWWESLQGAFASSVKRSGLPACCFLPAFPVPLRLPWLKPVPAGPAHGCTELPARRGGSCRLSQPVGAALQGQRYWVLRGWEQQVWRQDAAVSRVHLGQEPASVRDYTGPSVAGESLNPSWASVSSLDRTVGVPACPMGWQDCAPQRPFLWVHPARRWCPGQRRCSSSRLAWPPTACLSPGVAPLLTRARRQQRQDPPGAPAPSGHGSDRL